MSTLKKLSLLFVALSVIFTALGATAFPAAAESAFSQRVYASKVQEDKEVSLVGKHLAASTRYSVYLSHLSQYNTQAILVGKVQTDKSGSFTAVYRLPKKLVDRVKVYIHVVNKYGYVDSNWFINATAEGSTGGAGMSAPSLKVSEVKKGQVQIKVSSLPANVLFDVYIGKEGTKGIGGEKVGTIRDDDGGGVKATFDIPSSLKDRSKLDIRLENRQLGISTYVTFET